MQVKEIHLNEGFILREMGGEFHIFEEKEKSKGAVVGMPSLNEAGIFLWHQLEQKKTVSELIALLCTKNQLEEEEAMDEVHEFLAKLLHCHIIELNFINGSEG